MEKGKRHEWILNWIKNYGEPVDVLNTYFVDAYIKATKANYSVRMYGANYCPQLGGDLLAMTKACLLKRRRTGIQGFGAMGFPRWVWSYEIAAAEAAIAAAEKAKGGV